MGVAIAPLRLEIDRCIHTSIMAESCYMDTPERLLQICTHRCLAAVHCRTGPVFIEIFG
jgi:hypothetical protein